MSQHNRAFKPVPGLRQQRGIALVVVLILLLIMTLLGLASLRGTLLEERMSGNLFDRSLGFQAAEAALRQGEVVAAAIGVAPTGTCAAGVCPQPTAGLNRALGDADWANAATLANNTLAVANATDLQYLVEYMGVYNTTAKCDLIKNADGSPKDPLCKARVFRISSRYNAAGRASIVLQSVLRMPSP